MNITIEQIEELRSLTHVSFEEAERTLRKVKGNLPRAIAIIEHRRNSKLTKLVNEIARLFTQLRSYRLMIRRHNTILINLSIFTIILIGIFLPYISLAHIVILTLIGLLTECDFRIINTNRQTKQTVTSNVPNSQADLKAMTVDDEIIIGVNKENKTRTNTETKSEPSMANASPATPSNQQNTSAQMLKAQTIKEDATGYSEIVIK